MLQCGLRYYFIANSINGRLQLVLVPPVLTREERAEPVRWEFVRAIGLRSFDHFQSRRD